MANFIKDIFLQILIVWFCHAYNITKLTAPVQHAEGPYWCPYTRTLVYIDTFHASMYKYSLDDNVLTSFKLPQHNTIGFALKKQDEPEKYLIFADRDIIYMKWPFTDSPILFKTILSIERDKPKNQFNDGKADSKGRLWGGTLTREEDLSVTPNGGGLYMIDQNLTVHTRLSNVSVSNGLAWNKNNTKFYFIDSATKTIDEYDYEEETGNIGNKRMVLNITEHGYSGIADGMTIDENDKLWIALFGGHIIIQVDPRSGTVLQTVEMPVTYITSVIWGGIDYGILFVSTSRLQLTEEQLANEPDAGSVFAITELGTRGLPPNQFR